jgi:PTH1 family peptidyl-tRNA hydrolase
MKARIINRFTDFFSGYQAGGAIEYIVVGLGNPGREYESTRHNAGFMALDKLAMKHNAAVTKLKFKALCGDAMIGGKRALLLKPSTYMNKSGESVLEAMQFYKVPIERVIVLSDDVALDIGTLRIRRSGSDGGQKGLRNIIYLTGKDTFPRVRLGVGAKPHPGMDMAAWVLSKFSKDDMIKLDSVLDDAVSAVELIVKGQVQDAMNRFNE